MCFRAALVVPRAAQSVSTNRANYWFRRLHAYRVLLLFMPALCMMCVSAVYATEDGQAREPVNNAVVANLTRKIADHAISNFSDASLNDLYTYVLNLEQMLTAVQYQIAIQQRNDAQNYDVSHLFKQRRQALANQRRAAATATTNQQRKATNQQRAPAKTTTNQHAVDASHVISRARRSIDRKQSIIEALSIYDPDAQNDTLLDDALTNFATEFETSLIPEEKLSEVDKLDRLTQLVLLSVMDTPPTNYTVEYESMPIATTSSTTTTTLMHTTTTEEVDSTTTSDTGDVESETPDPFAGRRFVVLGMSTTTQSTNHVNRSTAAPTSINETSSTTTSPLADSIIKPNISSTVAPLVLLNVTEPSTSTTRTNHTSTTAAIETSTQPVITSSSETSVNQTSQTSSVSSSTTEELPNTTTTTLDPCVKLTQEQLVTELKSKGTYNPDLMAWDVPGVIRFLENTGTKYSSIRRNKTEEARAVERNLNSLERILRELQVDCDVRSPDVVSRLYNMTYKRHSREQQATSWQRLRFPRSTADSDRLRREYVSVIQRDDARMFVNEHELDTKHSEQRTHVDQTSTSTDSNVVGQVHVVPFGCSERGSSEDGYLRLCAACQAIRRLPDDFFPPFINEVICDEDKACLYFYDYPHGKCKQKHMNFVVLRNMGTRDCQIWRKFNLSVRVSCECFVDEMSFFAKYV